MKIYLLLSVVVLVFFQSIKKILEYFDVFYFYTLNQHLIFMPDCYNYIWAFLSLRSLNSLPLYPIVFSFYLYLKEKKWKKEAFWMLIGGIVFFEIVFNSINYLFFHIFQINRSSPSEILPFFDLRQYSGFGDKIKVTSSISFPSGHAFVLSFWYFFYSFLRPQSSSFWIGSLGILFCLRRLIAGAHWISDILSGAFLGYLTCELYILVSSHYLAKKNV